MTLTLKSFSTNMLSWLLVVLGVASGSITVYSLVFNLIPIPEGVILTAMAVGVVGLGFALKTDPRLVFVALFLAIALLGHSLVRVVQEGPTPRTIGSMILTAGLVLFAFLALRSQPP